MAKFYVTNEIKKQYGDDEMYEISINMKDLSLEQATNLLAEAEKLVGNKNEK